MRNVVALDAQQRVGQLQRLLQLHEGGATGGQITGTAALVQGQRLARILGDRLHELCLVAALRDANLHGPAAHLRQPGRQLLLILGLHRHEHGTRNIVAVQALLGVLLGGEARRDIAVHLRDQLLDELCVGAVVDLLHDPAALAADPAAAHEEHLNGRLQVVLSVGEQVGIHGRAEHHGVTLKRLSQRGNIVTKNRGTLKVHISCGGLHFRGQLGDMLLSATTHKPGQPARQLAVLLGANLAHARRRALIDITEQARAAAILRAVKHAVRAGAHREHAQQRIQGFTNRPRLRIGAKIAHTLTALTASHHRARVHVIDRNRQVRVRLIVTERNVEPRRKLLNPGVFKLQRFHLARHHGPLHTRRRMHHRIGLRAQRLRGRKIAVETVAQVLRLAHVDDATIGITKTVNARVGGDFAGGGAVAGRLCHGYFLLALLGFLLGCRGRCGPLLGCRGHLRLAHTTNRASYTHLPNARGLVRECAV